MTRVRRIYRRVQNHRICKAIEVRVAMTSISSMCSLGTLGTDHQYQSLRGKQLENPMRQLEVLWHPGYLGLFGKIGSTIASPKRRVQLYSPKAAGSLSRPPEITVPRRRDIVRLRGRRHLHPRWLNIETVLERHVVDVRKARAEFREASARRHDTWVW